MNSWIKRSLAFLLCLVMLCTLLPELSARAEEIELIPIDGEEEIIAGEPVDEEIVILDEEDFEEQHILNPNGEAPYIEVSPSSVTKTAGYTAKFTVTATGSSLKYQWYYRTSSSGSWQKTSLTGNTTATLSVKAKTTRNGFQYRCKVSNSYGYMYSKAATLTVKSGAKPTITTQPTSVTGSVGVTAKFTVKANNATKYQWYYRTSSSGSWAKSTLTGNTTATLSVYVKSTRDGYQYRCKVSNSNGYVYSTVARLTCKLGAKPTITTQPLSYVASTEATIYFKVKASGAESFQWYYRTSPSGSWNASTLTGCTTATLTVKAKSSRDGYQYRCKVTNAAGSVYSGAATLSISYERGGEDTNWKLSSDGLLQISGSGDMVEFMEFSPWWEYKEEIKAAEIDEGVTSLVFCAFGGCVNMKSVSFPDSLVRMNGEDFNMCDGLTRISVSSGNPKYSSKNGILYSKDGTELIRYPAGKSSVFVIPDGVQRIGSEAFYTNGKLTSVTIPVSVTSIGYCAFLECGNLTDIYYKGTKSQWNQIDIEGHFDITVHYNA